MPSIGSGARRGHIIREVTLPPAPENATVRHPPGTDIIRTIGLQDQAMHSMDSTEAPGTEHGARSLAGKLTGLSTAIASISESLPMPLA